MPEWNFKGAKKINSAIHRQKPAIRIGEYHFSPKTSKFTVTNLLLAASYNRKKQIPAAITASPDFEYYTKKGGVTPMGKGIAKKY